MTSVENQGRPVPSCTKRLFGMHSVQAERPPSPRLNQKIEMRSQNPDRATVIAALEDGSRMRECRDSSGGLALR
jgi:hypothetical protein